MFAGLAVLLAVHSILNHLNHYRQPALQKHVVRILWMVPPFRDALDASAAVNPSNPAHVRTDAVYAVLAPLAGTDLRVELLDGAALQGYLALLRRLPRELRSIRGLQLRQVPDDLSRQRLIGPQKSLHSPMWVSCTLLTLRGGLQTSSETHLASRLAVQPVRPPFSDQRRGVTFGAAVAATVGTAVPNGWYWPPGDTAHDPFLLPARLVRPRGLRRELGGSMREPSRAAPRAPHAASSCLSRGRAQGTAERVHQQRALRRAAVPERISRADVYCGRGYNILLY